MTTAFAIALFLPALAVNIFAARYIMISYRVARMRRQWREQLAKSVEPPCESSVFFSVDSFKN